MLALAAIMLSFAAVSAHGQHPHAVTSGSAGIMRVTKLVDVTGTLPLGGLPASSFCRRPGS